MSFDAIRYFWKKWEQTILTSIAMIVVGLSSYLFGLTHNTQTNDSLQISTVEGSNTVVCSAQCDTLGIDTSGQDVGSDLELDIAEDRARGEQIGIDQAKVDECLFLGSVNGSKYYPPNCKAINRIKKENLTCFTSAADAQNKGYSRTKSC